MCGIVGAISFSDEPVNELIVKQFTDQRLRGTQGFGLFDYQYKNIVKETKEESILKWLEKYPSTNILFHHRLPTSTANVKSAAHPFSTKDFFRTNYVLVHNGVIGNDFELRDEHYKLGITYQSMQQDGSFNDSEALLWDVALFLEGKQPSIRAEGSIAFVCVAIGKGNKHDRMWFGRNTSPLNMFHSETDGIMLSSEGAGEPIERDTLYCFDYVNHKLTSKDCTILTGWESYQASKPYNSRGNTSLLPYGGYSDYQEQEDNYYNHLADYGDASAEEGLRFIRFYKADKTIQKGEVSMVYNRVLADNQYRHEEAMAQIQYEYDCLTLLFDNYQLRGIGTVDVDYSMTIYETVEDRLEADIRQWDNIGEYQPNLEEV